MTSTLSHFWQLASSSKADRLDSAHGLVQTLISQQDKSASAMPTVARKPDRQLFDDGLARSGGQAATSLTDEDVREAEAALTAAGSADLAYAVKRLIKGLASHRESARLGFSVALSELLSHVHSVSTSHLLTLVLAYSTPSSGKIKGQEERDLLFARLFGVHALTQSGMLFDDNLSDAQDFQRTIDALWSISKGKPWLREAAASIIVQVIGALAESATSWRAECQLWLVEKVCSEKIVTADSIATYLALQRTCSSVFTSAHRLQHVASQELLAPANLPVLARVLRDSNVTPQADLQQQNKDKSDPQTASADAVGASGSAKAHFVWDALLQTYAEGASRSSKRAPFADAFRVLVDENLFSATASHQKKAWGFQVMAKAAQTVAEEYVPQIFQPNAMRTVINQLGGKDRVLYKAAQKACVGLQQAAKERPSTAHAMVLQLIGEHGSLRFDSMTSTKTVETILWSLDDEQVRQYTEHLINIACTEEDDGTRKSVFDQLLILVRSPHIKTDWACIEGILAFFATHGLLTMVKPSIKFASLGSMPDPVFSPSARASCRSRFLSCLSELHGASVASANATEEADVVDWIARGHTLLRSLEQDKTHFQATGNAGVVSWTRAEKVIKNVDDASKKMALEDEERKKYAALRTFVIASVLYVQCSQLDEDEAHELLDPLCDFAEHFVATSKSKAAAAASADEPGPMELFVQCVSNALQPSSAFLRGIATDAFDRFADQLTRPAMRLLIEQLGFNQKEAEDEAADEGEADEDDDEQMSDSVSVTSATSSASNDNDEDEEVDEEFAAKVREALQSGGVADKHESGAKEGEEDDDEDDDDESDASSQQSDFDDEQMLLIDDKLADIFRQKFTARKAEDQAKKEEVASHVRIIDLLDHYARHNGKSGLCVEMVLPLFTIAMEKDKALDALRQRAANVLQKSLFKGKTWPTDVAGEDVAEALDAVHKMACTSLPSPHFALANAANLYLTRSVSGGTFGSVPEAVHTVYVATLQDFMERKANNLKPSFLVEAFSRFPRLGFAMRKELLEAASGPQDTAQHAFRQVQAMEMLRTIAMQLTAQRLLSGDAEEVAFDEVMRALAALTLQRASQDKLRIKEILKVGLQLVRIVKKRSEQRGGEQQEDYVQRFWSAEHVQAAIDALASTNALPNSASLQGLLKQMLALTKTKASKTEASKTEASKTEAKQAKRPLVVERAAEPSKGKANKKSKRA